MRTGSTARDCKAGPAKDVRVPILSFLQSYVRATTTAVKCLRSGASEVQLVYEKKAADRKMADYDKSILVHKIHEFLKQLRSGSEDFSVESVPGPVSVFLVRRTVNAIESPNGLFSSVAH